MQVTWDLKNEAPRSWRLEGAQQIQAYKNRMPTTFYLLSSMWISKVFHINKTRVSHCHQNPPSHNNLSQKSSITYHAGAAST